MATLACVPLGARTKSDPRSRNDYELELELELIQTQMAQKPVLRAEVYAHAMRASQNRPVLATTTTKRPLTKVI